MTDSLGGFYSAEDADSEGEEGLFYLWKIEELNSILEGEDARFVQHVFNLQPDGNSLVPVHPRGRPPGSVHRAVFAGTRDGPLDRGRGDRDEGGDRRHAEPTRPEISGKGHVSANRPVEVLRRFLTGHAF